MSQSDTWIVTITPTYGNLFGGEGLLLAESTIAASSSDITFAVEEALTALKTATFGGGGCEPPHRMTIEVRKEEADE